MLNSIIIGLDLAGRQENPTGWALWKNKKVKTSTVYKDEEILRQISENKPESVAIDAPLQLPKEGIFRKVDKEMMRRGFRVFPPGLPAMRMLTIRAMELNKLITEMGIKTFEVHPSSTRRALNMPLKKWEEIQKVLETMGILDCVNRKMTSHEIDATTAALTAYLHKQGLTEVIGNSEDGYVIVPKRINWSKIKL
ncbi:MAG: DUF429 domain-containing protein [Candidatus Bathyarchaeota archaeon]|nr:DUF429 domain-containing protein [Candidatus Bathyarchaeota archaeon]MCX8176763.1 DUF429 domain-containing protein [Candidatus Bathyarchaeota archaeon]MDW8193292.1 DUF429 domain-containing protein [Nitrososphaerota archaeon]